MNRIEQLMAQGHTLEEAATVQHVIATAQADRDVALRTGVCVDCGGRFARSSGRIECRGCDAVHAA